MNRVKKFKVHFNHLTSKSNGKQLRVTSGGLTMTIAMFYQIQSDIYTYFFSSRYLSIIKSIFLISIFDLS